MRRFIIIIALCLLALSPNNISFSDTVTNCRSFDRCTSRPKQNGICYIDISYTKCNNTPQLNLWMYLPEPSTATYKKVKCTLSKLQVSLIAYVVPVF